MEIAEKTYTDRYASGDYTANILTFDKNDSNADIIGNLETGEGIVSDKYNCFIMTQTLPFIFDIKTAAENSIKLLKKGGTLLITVPGITQISRYDMDRWGHYWSFTDLSLRKLYSDIVPSENIEIETFGNVKTAASFLYGYSQEDLIKKDFKKNDNDYQLIIGARITK